MGWPSRERLRAFYDRLGPKQDGQWWYEDAATAALAERADFEHARAVFELGCGTGRFAAAMLAERLPAEAVWHTVDLSPRMVRLARERLAGYGGRVHVAETDGEPPFDAPAGGYDRVVANYVFDLLAPGAIEAMLAEAARLLVAGVQLCVTGLGPGADPLGRAVARAWALVHRLAPMAVGGCRPLDLRPHLAPETWVVESSAATRAYAIPSAIVIVRRRGPATEPQDGPSNPSLRFPGRLSPIWGL